jgi:hypothetical protein
MLEQLDTLEQEALAALARATDPETLAAWKQAHLGRSAPLATFLGDLGKLPAAERPLAEIGRAHV